jgi:hypothetical protein
MPTSTEIQDDLRVLGRVLSGSADEKYREGFEEFVREHEFDLALHAVCDYLAERAPVRESAILDQVERLHFLMGIKDDCLLRLTRAQARD